jgi:hypothetical protein
MHFGENQLSPGSIGISPLPTGHPHALQRTWVRAFTACYRRCTLPMGSSPGFGSTPTDYAPSSDSPSLRLRRGCALASPADVTRRIMLQKARHQAGPRLAATATAL